MYKFAAHKIKQLGDYPKKPYSIIVDGHTYTVHEQERNRFLVTHEIPYTHVISFMVTGIFVLSHKKIWHVEGLSNINEGHRPGIFHAIESGIGKSIDMSGPIINQVPEVK